MPLASILACKSSFRRHVTQHAPWNQQGPKGALPKKKSSSSLQFSGANGSRQPRYAFSKALCRGMLLRWPGQLCISTYGTKIVQKIPLNTTNQGLKAQNAIDLESLKGKQNNNSGNNNTATITIAITTTMMIIKTIIIIIMIILIVVRIIVLITRIIRMMV